MRTLLWVFLLVSLFSVGFSGYHDAEVDDNEFAEFEDEESDFVTDAPPKELKKPDSTEESTTRKTQTPTPAAVADDDFEDDFGVVEEVEEQREDEINEDKKIEPLKFTDVPAHFRSNWASYQVEALILFVIAVYLVNYVTGRSQNQSVAYDWFENCKDLLQEQFALVGDDGVGDGLTGGHLIRETDSSYTVWCSGRVGVNGLLVQLRTVKRQDLLSRVMAIFSPTNDRITFKFELDAGEMDAFVLAFGQRKPTTREFKEMMDLSTFAPEKKNLAQFGLPASYALFSEQPEAAYAIFDQTVSSMTRRHEKAIEYIHISDQYSGPKPPEGETYTRLPEKVCLVQCTMNLSECTSSDDQLELLQLVLYIVEKVRRLRLSKEAKSKADKRRREVEEAFLKTTHLMRQEAAQARKEEKIRDRKQRLLDEEDPEKQRRLEKLEMKREAKAKQPKMKQLKMKM